MTKKARLVKLSFISTVGEIHTSDQNLLFLTDITDTLLQSVWIEPAALVHPLNTAVNSESSHGE